MKIHLVGGFLGSGKTTAIISASKSLMAKGLKIGVITNDQGKYLVDTHFLRLEDIPTVEVNGGCFCCNYTNFDESLDLLTARFRPDIIFAESVGSCADIVATVLQPLLKHKGNSPEETSLSVFTDARLLKAFLNGRDLPFQEGVIYIFEKQIEEANILVINKIDLLDQKDANELVWVTQLKYPEKVIIAQSSLSPDTVHPWLERLNSNPTYALDIPLSIDYRIYGSGEQILAWYDSVYQLSGEADQILSWINQFITTIRDRIMQEEIPVGHLKFLVSDGIHHQKFSITSGDYAENTVDMLNKLYRSPIQLITNARLECPQHQIQQLFHGVIDQMQSWQAIDCFIQEEQSFHPGFPEPTHRLI